MKLARFRPSASTTIAFVALFALIASTAYASGLSKNSVTNRSIRKNAVTGTKVKNSSLTGADVKGNSLTGSDIKESTLGTVPHATDASTVGGIAPSQLATNDRFVTGSVLLARGQEQQVIAAGPFAVIANCAPGGTDTKVLPKMRVTTTGTGGFAYVTGTNALPADTDFDGALAKEVDLFGGGGTAVRAKATPGSFDLYDPASGVVLVGTVNPYLNFGAGTNCRFAWFATVAKP